MGSTSKWIISSSADAYDWQDCSGQRAPSPSPAHCGKPDMMKGVAASQHSNSFAQSLQKTALLGNVIITELCFVCPGRQRRNTSYSGLLEKETSDEEEDASLCQSCLPLHSAKSRLAHFIVSSFVSTEEECCSSASRH